MHSQWYLIALAVRTRVEVVAADFGCTYLDNPAIPLDLKSPQQQRAVFVLQRGDRVLDQPGQQREKRRMRVVVGAVDLTATSLSDADELHFAVRLALRADAFRVLLRATGDVAAVREVEIEPELKEIVTEGSALLSAFEIDYFQNYPNAA